MKKIKEESLKIFSKNNFKNLAFIIIIKFFINLFIIFLTFLTLYSFTDYKEPKNTFLYYILLPVSYTKNLKFFSSNIVFTFFLFYAIILYIPLRMGIYLWFSKIEKDNNPSLIIIFNYYKNLKLLTKCILFELNLFINSILNLLFWFLPTIAAFIFICLKTQNSASELQIFLRLLILSFIVIFFIEIFIFVKKQISHIVARFLFVKNDSEKIFSITKSSNFLIRKNDKQFKKFLLSFWKSLILCLLLFPIPFLVSHFYMCIYEFTKKIAYKQNQGISQIPLSQKVIDINI